MSGSIAVLNAGSSSVKFAVHAAEDGPAAWRGQVQSIGIQPSLIVRDAAGHTIVERSWPAEGFDHAAATRAILDTAIGLLGGERVAAVGHRVVHGGAQYSAPIRVDAAVVDDLERLVPLAPLHQPHNLAPIRAILAHAPHLPQVACFDTAFHRSQDAVAQRFALPRRFEALGVRRYGFHGLSFEFVSSRLRELAPGIAGRRLVIAHLGNGASLCAVDAGCSVAATTGFTALDGLVMGTRSGALDPGVILHLLDAEGMDGRAIEKLLYQQSGLLGISGISSDMRTLRASAAPEAAEAIELFVYRIIREIGSMAAALGGLDGLVFSGGIGENDAATRAEVMQGCAWLGIVPDAPANQTGNGRISAAGQGPEVWVVPTDEERMIARHAATLLNVE